MGRGGAYKDEMTFEVQRHFGKWSRERCARWQARAELGEKGLNRVAEEQKHERNDDAMSAGG